MHVLSRPDCPVHSRSQLDYEIVIVDDNSPDGTQEVVQRLQQSYGLDRIVSTTQISCNIPLVFITMHGPETPQFTFI